MMKWRRTCLYVSVKAHPLFIRAELKHFLQLFHFQIAMCKIHTNIIIYKFKFLHWEKYGGKKTICLPLCSLYMIAPRPPGGALPPALGITAL